MRATIVGGLLAIVGAVTAVVIPLVAASGGGPALDLVDVEVERGTPYTNDQQVSIAVTLLNNGDSRGVVSEAVFTVEDVLLVKSCISQGALVLSGVYDLRLPPDAAVGDRFQVDVSQQLGPDEADKFAFRTQLETGVGQAFLLFRLGVVMDVNGGEDTVDAGSVVLSLGSALPSAGLYATDDIDEEVKQDGLDVEAARACLYDNSEKIHTFLAEPGPRPGDLEDADEALRLRP